ncbi:hypothetical protein SAMN05421539_104336 [Jannaschia seohaensis]|uniref:Uncharacterized protein n=1 Tax=Jannaschia seohaensis TaxID=475081 RepID=A0A2Y9ANL9_9RHOB|nr:hypothetical protein BCF38_104336 [Jannaschia seohaensis]SSA46061.1 hypothetical protein SAMN05421539_104336 [Jannaschia seohaensis]
MRPKWAATQEEARADRINSARWPRNEQVAP